MLTNRDTLMVLWLSGTGFFLLIMGILIRLGVYRSPYAMKGNPAFAPNKLGHLLIPGSLIPLLFAILPFLESEESRLRLFVYFMLPFQLIIIILGIWEPWWLKPKWLRWLEREHADVLHLLWEDVRKDRWGWERRVRTQRDLENWVAEVRRKHGLDS